MNKYRTRKTTILELMRLVQQGKTLVEMANITGKHNEWIKRELTNHYNMFGKKIEFRAGRYGGIFIDDVKVSR